MKKYMLVYTMEGEQGTLFSDNSETINQSKMDIECGMGGYAEVYERMETENGNEYVFSWA